MKKRLLSGLLAVMMVCLSIMTVASAAPATQPPAGAEVVDLTDTLTGDIEHAPESEAA